MTLPARKMSALGQKRTCAVHCQKWTSRVRVYLTPMWLGREPQTCQQPRRYDCRWDDNMTLQIEPRHDSPRMRSTQLKIASTTTIAMQPVAMTAKTWAL
jgi:hypothetical protein